MRFSNDPTKAMGSCLLGGGSRHRARLVVWITRLWLLRSTTASPRTDWTSRLIPMLPLWFATNLYARDSQGGATYNPLDTKQWPDSRGRLASHGRMSDGHEFN